jgi:hypothetical protein
MTSPLVTIGEPEECLSLIASEEVLKSANAACRSGYGRRQSPQRWQVGPVMAKGEVRKGGMSVPLLPNVNIRKGGVSVPLWPKVKSTKVACRSHYARR